MKGSNDLNERLREIIRDLEQERNGILIQQRPLTPAERRVVGQIEVVLPHLHQLSGELAGEDDTPGYQASPA